MSALLVDKLEAFQPHPQDILVVQAAALLHDIGIPRARELHGEKATDYYEVEGPPVAREILAESEIPKAKLDTQPIEPTMYK